MQKRATRKKLSSSDRCSRICRRSRSPDRSAQRLGGMQAISPRPGSTRPVVSRIRNSMSSPDAGRAAARDGRVRLVDEFYQVSHPVCRRAEQAISGTDVELGATSFHCQQKTLVLCPCTPTTGFCALRSRYLPSHPPDDVRSLRMRCCQDCRSIPQYERIRARAPINVPGEVRYLFLRSCETMSGSHTAWWRQVRTARWLQSSGLPSLTQRWTCTQVCLLPRRIGVNVVLCGGIADILGAESCCRLANFLDEICGLGEEAGMLFEEGLSVSGVSAFAKGKHAAFLSRNGTFLPPDSGSFDTDSARNSRQEPTTPAQSVSGIRFFAFLFRGYAMSGADDVSSSSSSSSFC